MDLEIDEEQYSFPSAGSLQYQILLRVIKAVHANIVSEEPEAWVSLSLLCESKSRKALHIMRPGIKPASMNKFLTENRSRKFILSNKFVSTSVQFTIRGCKYYVTYFHRIQDKLQQEQTAAGIDLSNDIAEAANAQLMLLKIEEFINKLGIKRLLDTV